MKILWFLNLPAFFYPDQPTVLFSAFDSWLPALVHYIFIVVRISNPSVGRVFGAVITKYQVKRRDNNAVPKLARINPLAYDV